MCNAPKEPTTVSRRAMMLTWTMRRRTGLRGLQLLCAEVHSDAWTFA